MSYETITYTVEGNVGHLRLNRPNGANAVSEAFARDLRDVMIEIEFDDAVRAVSVTAEGKVFCAGGDLKEFHGMGAELPKHGAKVVGPFHAALYKMNRMTKPFVAGVRGAAGGAGLSLVGAFDLVISGESSKYTMAYTRAGMTPDGTSSYFIGRHIGLRRMLDLTLTNRVLDAATAESWGLVNRVVADDEVDAATAAMAPSTSEGNWWRPDPRPADNLRGRGIHLKCMRGRRERERYMGERMCVRVCARAHVHERTCTCAHARARTHTHVRARP